jgi:hypothetical protein
MTDRDSTRHTPETDAVWADKSENILEHARTLERKRDEALAALAKCLASLVETESYDQT